MASKKASPQSPFDLATIKKLLSVGQSLTVVQDLKALLWKIVKTAGTILKADVIVLYEYQEETKDILIPPVIWGDIRQGEILEERGIKQPSHESAVFKILQQAQPFFASDSVKDWNDLLGPYSINNQDGFIQRENIVSSAAICLLADKERVGILFVNYRTHHDFLTKERIIIELVASQAAIAIQNARLLERERRLRMQADTLREVSIAISSATELKETAGRILDALGKVIEYCKATMQSIRGDSRTIIAQRGFKEDDIHPWLLRPISQDKLIQRAVKSARPLILSITTQDPDWEINPQTGSVHSWAGVPIIYANETIGLLTLDHDLPGFYKPAIEDLLTSFAHQAAIAVKNAMLFDDTRQRIRDLQVLSDIAPVMAAKLDTQDLLRTIISQIEEKLECSHCTVFFPQEEDGEIWLKPQVTHGKRSNIIKSRRFKPGEGLAGWVYQTGTSIVLPDAHQDERFSSARYHSDLPRSMLVVPIKAGEQPIGVISADQDRYGWFDEDDLRLVEALAIQAVFAIQRNRGLDLLQDVSSRITSAHDVDEILQLIVSGAIELTHTTSGVIYLVEENGQLAEKRFKYPPDSYHPEPRMDQEDSSTRRVIDTGQVLIFQDVHNDPRVNPELRDRISSMIALPLMRNRKVIGVLYLNDQYPHDFTETEKTLLMSLANQAATAIYKAELMVNLERQVKGHRALNKVGVELVGMQAESKILNAVARSVTKTLGCHHCSVFCVEADNFVVRATYGARTKEFKIGRPFKLGQGVAGWVAKEGKPALVADTARDQRFDPTWSVTPPLAVVAVPIYMDQKVYGVISAEEDRQNGFDEQDQRLLETLALQASQAIKNARQVHDLEILNRAGHLISSQLEIDQLFNTLLDIVNNMLGCQHSTLFVIGPKGDLVARSRRGYPERDLESLHFNIGQGAAGWVVQHRQSLNIPDVNQDDRFLPDRASSHHGASHSALLAPMLLQNAVIGVISVDREKVDGFDDNDQRILETLAIQAAIAYENARLYQETKQQTDELSLLHEVSAQLMTLDLDMLLRLIVDGATRLTNTELGVIYLLSEDGTRIVKSFGGSPEFASSRLQLSKGGLTRIIFETGEPVYITNIKGDKRVSADVESWGFRSFIGQPLKVSNKVIGVLYLNDVDPREYSTAEQILITTLASQAAVAIENARIYAALQRRVKHLDALNRVSAQISLLPDRQEIFDTVVKEASDTLQASQCVLFILNEQKVLLPQAARGLSPKKIATLAFGMGDGLEGWVAQEGKSASVLDANQDPRVIKIIATQPNVACPKILAPVWVEGKVIGVMTAAREGGAIFDEADLLFLETLAVQAGIFVRQEHLRRMRVEAIYHNFNPYIVGEPIREPHDFYGRTQFIQDIVNGIHNNNFIIYGERRIGKTSLLNQLVHSLTSISAQGKDLYFFPVFANLQSVVEDHFFGFLIEQIASTLQIPNFEKVRHLDHVNYDHTDLEQDLQEAIEFLKGKYPDREIRIILLLDEMDQFVDYGSRTHECFRSLFISRIGVHFKMIMAGVSVQRVQQARTSPWYNLFIEKELSSLEEEAARRLIIEPVRGYYTYTQEAIKSLLAYSDLKPLEIQRLAFHAVSLMLSRLNSTPRSTSPYLSSSVLTITKPDVDKALEQALKEKDGEYQDFWFNLDHDQRQALLDAANRNGIVNLSATHADGTPLFTREDLYNVMTSREGNQVRFAFLFMKWLKGME